MKRKYRLRFAICCGQITITVCPYASVYTAAEDLSGRKVLLDPEADELQIILQHSG